LFILPRHILRRLLTWKGLWSYLISATLWDFFLYIKKLYMQGFFWQIFLYIKIYKYKLKNSCIYIYIYNLINQELCMLKKSLTININENRKIDRHIYQDIWHCNMSNIHVGFEPVVLNKKSDMN
jgi:hypothetical protein